jgi:hypothetical protein
MFKTIETTSHRHAHKTLNKEHLPHPDFAAFQQVLQARNRPGLAPLTPACCSLLPGFVGWLENKQSNKHTKVTQ